jgi:signal transduction histidine kinase
VILSTKILFLLYLNEHFTNYDTRTLITAVVLGYKFDLALVATLTFLVILFDFHKKTFIALSVILSIVIVLFQISDIMYFYESTRHIGYELSDALTDISGLIMTAVSIHTTLLISSIVASIALAISLYKFYQYKLYAIAVNRYYIVNRVILIIITVFFARGMTQHIPLNPWQSNQIGDSKLTILSLNGSYNTLYALLNKKKYQTAPNLPFIDQDSKKEIKCSSNMAKLKDSALSFTSISQELLFSGKTDRFKEYK